jgi:hypothetical protein
MSFHSFSERPRSAAIGLHILGITGPSDSDFILFALSSFRLQAFYHTIFGIFMGIYLFLFLRKFNLMTHETTNNEA